jgi:hypothetical protein
MRTDALRALGLLLALALIALVLRGGTSLPLCARAAFASDEAAAILCANAAVALLALVLGLLLLVAVMVNILDQWRFATRGVPPQPEVLALLATCAALLAVASLLPARFAALAIAPSLSVAVESSLALVATIAEALAAVLAALAGLAIWLGPARPDPSEPGTRRQLRN